MKKNLGAFFSIIMIVAIAVSLYFIFSVEQEKIARTIKLDEETKAIFYVDGKKYDEVIIDEEKGKIEEMPKTPSKDGYVFNYWELNGEKFNLNDEILNSITLNAHFQKINSKKEVESINIPSNIYLQIDGTKQLEVSFNPIDASDKNIKWTSSDTSIATVDDKGNVKAKKEGKAIITVTTTNGKKAKCVATIVKKAETPKEEQESQPKQEIEYKKIDFIVSNLQLEKGKIIPLTQILSSTEGINIYYKLELENNTIAEINDKNIKANMMGSTKLKLLLNDEEQSSLNISVVPKDYIISLDYKTYQIYKKYTNITLSEDNNYPGMQNFAFSYFGTDKERLFLSTSAESHIPLNAFKNGEVDENSAIFKNVQRTIVYKITPEKMLLNRMYLELSGHGAGFDIEKNDEILWINDLGTAVSKDSSGYWAKNYGVMRIAFSPIPKYGSFDKMVSYKLIKDHVKYSSPEPCVDEENNMIAIVIANHIKIYNLEDFKNGVVTELYNFYLKPTTTASNLTRQGYAISNGYLYGLYGNGGQYPVVEAYNLNGYPVKSIRLKRGYSIANNREPEGIKVYNNQIFIGSILSKQKSSRGVDIVLNEIGYFK